MPKKDKKLEELLNLLPPRILFDKNSKKIEFEDRSLLDGGYGLLTILHPGNWVILYKPYDVFGSVLPDKVYLGASVTGAKTLSSSVIKTLKYLKRNKFI